MLILGTVGLQIRLSGVTLPSSSLYSMILFSSITLLHDKSNPSEFLTDAYLQAMTLCKEVAEF